MSIANITRKNAPCWYEVGLNKSTGAFVLRVHKDFTDKMKVVSDSGTWVSGVKNEYGFTTFNGKISLWNGYFGFDNSFLNKGLVDEFIELEAKLPLIMKKGDKCSHCKNSKNHHREYCTNCDGSGFLCVSDWTGASAISTSLSLFFSLVNSPGYVVDSSRAQLIVLQLDGKSFLGSFSAPFSCWLRENKEKVCDIALGSMVRAYRKMNEFGLTSVDEYHFRVSSENGNLIMNCPGNACGLQPEDYNDWNLENKGYSFGCHNVDTPLQQFTLFSGVFALHDEARKDGV